MAKLILGCGYLGRRVASRWRERGERVFAVTHLADRAEELAAGGFDPLVADVTRPDTLSRLPTAETVLYAVGYDRAGAASRREVLVDGLRAVLDALPGDTGRFIYISSTGVYGEAAGAWVDENTPCRPERESGRVILAAEEVLRAHPLGSRAIVLRLAGLYGPGRIPRMDDLLAGRPIAVHADAVVNLIHVDDAVAVVLAAEAQARPPATYVVSDGHPAPRREFYRYLAELLNLPPPTFVDMAPRRSQSPRGAGSKRVRNARVLQELKVQLAFPSYREGLAAIV